MVRGLAILCGFAAVLGGFVIWGPIQVSMRGRDSTHASLEQAPHESATNVSTTTLRSAAQHVGTVAPARKTENTAVESPPRDAVLAATPAAPASALAALPEKAIAGFPATPRDGFTNDQMMASIKQARSFRAQGQLVEARDLLSTTYLGHRLTKEQRRRLVEELDPLAAEIMRSRTILDDGELYDVEAGDTLLKLAKPFRVPPEFIARLNGISDPRRLRRGQTLKLVNGPFDVLVEPADFELTVLRRGKYARRFPIGIGRDDTPTPTGLNTVKDKQIKPTKWPDDLDRRTYSGGDPMNPLGSRWLGLGYGYGIHGTIEPDSIGQKSSRGCIRMRNPDVEELFDMVSEGSRVLIR